MAHEHSHTNEFRDARFSDVDLTGATFRACDLSQVRILGSQIDNLWITGWDGQAGTVVVDGVDVTEFVNSELDRRYPERVQMRSMRTADDYRAMWETVERLWAETRVRAERLAEPALYERVDGEWSFVETVRHLVFATEVWVDRMVLDRSDPFHSLGLPPTDLSPAGAAAVGIDRDAQPTYAEVVALHVDRMSRMRGVVGSVTDTELDEIRTTEVVPEWGAESQSVGECLRILVREHCEHRRFAERDLAMLQGGAPSAS